MNYSVNEKELAINLLNKMSFLKEYPDWAAYKSMKVARNDWENWEYFALLCTKEIKLAIIKEGLKK